MIFGSQTKLKDVATNKKYPNYLCWMHDCSITDSKLNIILNSKIKNIREYGFSKFLCYGRNYGFKQISKNYIYPYPLT